MEVAPLGKPPSHRVEFCGQQEIHAVAVGLMIYEYFSGDEDASAYTGLLLFQGKFPRRNSFTFTLDTRHSHERLLLEGLTWVARNKEELSNKILDEAIDLHGFEKALEYFDATTLDEHLDELQDITTQLEFEGVIGPPSL